MKQMIDTVLNKLDKVRQSGKGFKACCPAHDDREPSLSIAEGDDGQILVYCFAGCTVKDICESIGLTVSDLFPDRRKLTPGTKRNLSESLKKMKLQRRLEARRQEAFLSMVEFRNQTSKLFDYYKLDCPDELLKAVHMLPMLDHYLNILAAGTNEELLDLLRKGVIRKWSALYNLQE